METDNVLSDQVKICRPVFFKLLCAVSITVIADPGDIVGQCVQPYINHMFWVKVYRNSPFKGCSGHTQILKSRKKEVIHHLILPGYRLDKFRMFINIFNQLRSIFTHSEEIRLFLRRSYRTAAVRTFSIYQLRLGKERLAGCAIQPFIISLINISLVIKLFKDLLNLFFMVVIRGPDKLIIRSLHQIPDILDLTGYLIYKLLAADASFLCLQFNLLSVLIRSCLEKHIIPLLPLKPGNTIRQNRLISISNMRLP